MNYFTLKSLFTRRSIEWRHGFRFHLWHICCSINTGGWCWCWSNPEAKRGTLYVFFSNVTLKVELSSLHPVKLKIDVYELGCCC